MQRVAGSFAHFCAGSSTNASPLTAPCQIGRTQARRAGGFAAVGGGLRPPPNPPSGRVALRAARFLQGAFPRPLPPARFLQGAFPRPMPPALPLQSPPLPAGPCFLGIPLQGTGIGPQAVPPFGRDPPAQSAGPAARLLLSHLTAAAGPAARLPAPSSIPRPPPKPKPPTLPLGKPGACTFLHINSLTAPRFGLRPAAPDSPACSGGRRRPRRRNTPPAPPWPPGRHGRPRSPFR